MPVNLYGYGKWTLTLREERRLKMSENRVLKRMFWPTRDEVTGEWSKLHNEELNDQYFSPNIIRVMKSKRKRQAGHVACMGVKSGAYRIMVGKPTGKSPLGRLMRKLLDNIKMDLKEV